MSDTLLRSGLIRLAYANPHLRADLLPLIEKEAAGPSYKDYVDKKRKKGEKPLDEAAWESRVKGKGEGGKPEDKGDKGSEGGGKSLSPADGKKLGEALSQWHESGSDPIYAVSSNAAAGKPIPPEAAKKALSKIDTLLMGDMSPADKKQLSSAKAMLEKVTGAKSEGGGKSKSEKPKKTYKKNYRPTMESVMNKHGLTDDDAAEVIQFSIDRPKKGKEQSPAELMRRFMEKAKPETKERMKGMNPQEFMKMLRAVLDDEEGGGGKTASLRNGLIRLAYANPSLRPTLLPLIEKHAKSFDDAVKGKKFKHPETGNDVLFGSLPSEEQTKIRSQWVKKNPRGSGGDGSDPKAMLKEDSDKYFAQHVSGNIGKKSLTDALKGTGFAPRGKGSFDKKRGLVELYLDSEDRSSSPMRAVFSGSDYTKGDGKGYIRIDHPRHGQIDDSFKMTGDPEADAKQMHSALKELAEQMGDYEKEYKSSKKASVGNNMHAELDADADPTSHDQNLPEHYYFNKGAAKGESVEAEVKQFASPKSKDQNKPEHYYGLPPKGKQAARPLAPGVHLVEDLSVLGPNFRLVYRELGSDLLGSEQVPGYYLDLGGLLKLVVKTPKQSPAGEAQAKKVIANLLRMMKAGSVKTAMDFPSEAALKQYLRDHPGADKKKHKVRKDTTYEKHHAKVEEAVKDKFNDVTSHLSDTGLSEDEAFGDSEMASLGNKWFSVSRVKLNDAKNSADREKLNAVEKELGELAGKMKARITELAKSKKGKQASVKVAAGPDAAGRNWKKHTTAGITNWFWQGRPGEPIKQFMVIQKKDGAFDNSYWMTVKLEDGSFFQSPIQKAKPTDWFKRAAEIYAASQGMVLDFSEMPEKWKRLNGPAPVKTAGGSGAANAAFLRQSPLKNKVLQAVAKHYGVSVSEIESELTDPDAEALYEYIGNDRALQMQVYREFKSKGF